MNDWGGFGPREFGGYPVELEFSLESYAGPRWVSAGMRHRSGWLAVAEVEMETAFDCTTEILAALIDEGGEPVGQWVAEALFSMHCRLPREADLEPPEELDFALDALYWDFLGRCDLDHLRVLEEKERATALLTMRLDARHRNNYDAAESLILKLYAKRRRESGDPGIRMTIDAEIRELEDSQAAMERQQKASLASLSHKLEEFVIEVMESLRNHGRLTKLYAVHWIVKPSLTARTDQIFLRQCYSPPVHVLRASEVLPPYLTRDFVTMSRNPKVRAGSLPAKQPIRIAPRQSVQAPAAGERPPTYRKATKAEKLATDRATLERLYQQWEQTDPERFERERKLREQTAEFNRKRDNERELAAEVSALPPKRLTRAQIDDAKIRELRRKVFEIERVEKLNQQAVGFARQSAMEREQVTLPYGGPEQEGPQDRQRGDPPEPVPMPKVKVPTPPDDVASALAATNPSLAATVATRRPRTSSKAELPATPQDVIPAADQRETASSIEVPVPRSLVIAGDCVLLRLDGNSGSVQYTLKGDLNIPRRNIVALSDRRAQAIIGRNVGDRICIEIAGRERFAVIEKIVTPALPEAEPPAQPAASGSRPQHIIAGDCVLLRLEGASNGGFLQYTLWGDLNTPMGGVVALSDPRAQAILGRNVGDRVCLEIAGRERFVLIEKIMNFDR